MRLVITLAAAAALAACQNLMPDAPRAIAKLEPTKNGKASGSVDFYQVGGKVRIVGKVSGLVPGRQHGFHIHEAGDCSSGDGMSAKGHYNPLGKAHAHFSTPARHAGDMPALSADANGDASFDTEVDVITVTAGPTSIVGRGLIVHADPDDYKTQPTGNAGARIACAVIERR
jgi:Cu-Zn family superoxide dismutase